MKLYEVASINNPKKYSLFLVCCMLNSTWITCIHWPPIQRNEGFAQSESVLSPGVLKKSSLWTDRFWSLLQLWIQIRSERFLIRMNSIITRRIAIRTAIMMRIIIFSSLKIKFIFVISFFVSTRLKSILKIGPNIKPWFDIHLPYWSQNTQ